MMRKLCLLMRPLPNGAFSTLPKGALGGQRFWFSSKAEQGAEQIETEGEDRAGSFYRNSIRRVSTSEGGRGHFTEHHLLRLVKLVERVEQEPLLFEAHSNYLGHHTLISSTTVDKLLAKSLSFEGCSFNRVLGLLEDHSYYGYFPHYSVTRQALTVAHDRTAQGEENSLPSLLNILSKSPLIKFNPEIVSLLLSYLKDPASSNSTVSQIIKLLAQREQFKLLEGMITRRALLKAFSSAIEARLDNKTFQTFRRSDALRFWCTDLLSSEQVDEQLLYEVLVVSAAGKQKRLFADNLVLLKSKDKVIRALLYLELCPESFVRATVKYLNDADELTEDLRIRLQEFKFTPIDPSSVETE